MKKKDNNMKWIIGVGATATVVAIGVGATLILSKGERNEMVPPFAEAIPVDDETGEDGMDEGDELEIMFEAGFSAEDFDLDASDSGDFKQDNSTNKSNSSNNASTSDGVLKAGSGSGTNNATSNATSDGGNGAGSDDNETEIIGGSDNNNKSDTNANIGSNKNNEEETGNNAGDDSNSDNNEYSYDASQGRTYETIRIPVK